jgi:hypothetical protein
MKNRLLHFTLLPAFLVSSAFTHKQITIQAGNTQPVLREKENSSPTAEIKFREMHFRKPPLVELVFDVVLRNDRAQPRWFILPSHIYPDKPQIPEKGGVDVLEVFAPHGKGRVIIGRFLGTGGFQVLLLPAHSQIHLRSLPISYWGDVPDTMQVEIMTATRLMIDGKDAASWFNVNPSSSVRADISENPTDSNRMIRSRRTPDNREVTTHIEPDQRFKLPVSLREANQ